MGSHTLLLSHFWWQIRLSSFFAHRGGVRFGLVVLTLFLVAPSLAILSMMGGMLVDDHLTWQHWTEDVLLDLHLEDVVVRSAVVDDSSIELPWPSKEKMTNGHWDDVALQDVFVGADFEGDLYSVLDLDGAGVAKPLHFVWMWVLRLGKLELGAKFFTCQIVTTPSIDDDLDGSSIDASLGLEYGASLVFFLVMLESQDFGNNM